MLYQIDSQKRHPVPDLQTEYYYWTNVYYIEAANDGAAQSAALSLTNAELGVLSHLTQGESWQLHQPPGRGNLVGVVHSFWDSGTSIYPGERDVLNYMLIWLNWADGTRGYKRWRRPWSAADVAGGRFSSDDYNLMTFFFSNPLNGITLRSASGSPLVSAHADPLVRSWQMRRGTDRMSRAVLV
jgi:hypothetical protein